jgi:hypothetical protein
VTADRSTPGEASEAEEIASLTASLAVRRDLEDEDGNPDYIVEIGHLANVQPVVERILADHVRRARAEGALEALRGVEERIVGQRSCGILHREHDGCYVADSLRLVRDRIETEETK